MKKAHEPTAKKTGETEKQDVKRASQELDPRVFDGEVNKAVLYQVVNMYQANQRQGTASTKTRAVVAGGGRKPWKQKHTGRARAGSIRSPLWRGGGVVFGPHPRDYSFTVPQKMKVEALRSSLNAKHRDNELIVVDSVTIEKPKTKEFQKVLQSLKVNSSVLFVLDTIDANVKLASRNIGDVSLKKADDLNALDVLQCKSIVVTKPALAILTKRIQA